VAVKISLARALGTCFGVRDAIEAALDPSFRDNLTILGQLVHNPQTVEELRANGVKLVDSLDDEIETRNVMITAHGSSESVKAELRKRGHQVFDASCPLVLKVHNRVAKLVRDGYFPVVIGERNHVEVRGIVGDLEEYAVIGEPSEVSLLEGQSKIGIVCQTTHQVEDARAVIRAIEERFPQTEICFVDTICKPTKERQSAVRELVLEADLMVVVGGFNSSNTKKLLKVCVDQGIPSYHIEGAEDLEAGWFRQASHVGITAGTSTPHRVIEEVYDRIRTLATGIGLASEE